MSKKIHVGFNNLCVNGYLGRIYEFIIVDYFHQQ